MSNVSVLKNKMCWFFLVILVTGFFLRLYSLDKHDFWIDEVMTEFRISGGVYKNFNYELETYYDKHPPLYFYVLRWWCYIFGKSEFSLRFFSVIFGFLSILLVYKVSCLLFDRRCALLAAGFISFSPFHLWYAQEARMFTFSVFVVLLNFYFFIKILKEKNNKYWIGYFFSALASSFTTYFTFFFLISQMLILLLIKEYRSVFMKLFLNVAIIGFILIAIYLPKYYSQIVSFQRNFWLPNPSSIVILLLTLSNFILGYNGMPFTYCLVTALLTIAIIYVIRTRRINKEILVIFISLFLPIILVFLVSKFIPIYIDRHLIIFSPFLYILLSYSIMAIKHLGIKILIIVLLALTVIFSVFNYYNDIVSFRHMSPGVHLKKPIEPIVRFFLENMKVGDAMGFTNMGVRWPFFYYLRKLSSGDFCRDDFCAIPHFYFMIPHNDLYWEKILENASQLAAVKGFKLGCSFVNPEKEDFKKCGIKRLWLFASSWSRLGDLDNNSRAVKEWFDRHLSKQKELCIEGVWISIYDLEPTE